jgi:glycosyltransferase involved in cell wall biosynthesis
MPPRVCSISAIVPLHNEEGNVVPLVTELAGVLPTVSERYEIVLVDDGSTDGTVREILAEMQAHPERSVRLIRLRGNFGQTAALSAGFRRSLGETVVTLDGDLQNDPADIPALLAELEPDNDVVCGWRRERSEGLLRKSQTALAARVIGRMTGLKIHDYGCTLRVYRAEITKDLELWGDMHRFIPALCRAVGARVTEIPVHHRPRHKGEPKYGKTGLGRAGKVLMDLLTLGANLAHYRGKSLRFYGWWALTWVIGAAFALVLALTGHEEAAEVAGISATMVLSALVLLGLGVQAELSNQITVRLLGCGPGYVRDETPSPGWTAAWASSEDAPAK